MKFILKLLLISCSLHIPLIASYKPIAQDEKEQAASKPKLELAGISASEREESIHTPATNLPARTAKKTCADKINISCITACITLAVLGAIVTPIALHISRPHEHSCNNPRSDTDMTNQCYDLLVSGCGICDTDHLSYVSCPVNGNANATFLLEQTRAELDPICSSDAQYCIRQRPCSENGYICVTDRLARFKKTLKTQCTKLGNSNSTAHAKQKTNLRTKVMMRSNNGRKK